MRPSKTCSPESCDAVREAAGDRDHDRPAVDSAGVSHGALLRAAYYRPPRDRLMQDQPVIDALQAIVAKRTRWGFWKCFDRLRNQANGGTTSACIACTARCA
jgi:hypothetical protein